VKIMVQNSDQLGMALVTTRDREGAKHDQSIMGSAWEAPHDMDCAYACVPDREGLVQALEAEGYDVEHSQYYPFDPRDYQETEGELRWKADDDDGGAL